MQFNRRDALPGHPVHPRVFAVYGRWKRDCFHETSGARGDVREHDYEREHGHTHPLYTTQHGMAHTSLLFSRLLRSRQLLSSFLPHNSNHSLSFYLLPSSLLSDVFVSRTALIFGVTALSARPDLDATSGVFFGIS